MRTSSLFAKSSRPHVTAPIGLFAAAAVSMLTVAMVASAAPLQAVGSENDAAPQQRWWERPEQGVYKARLVPHWLADSPRFWYRNDLSDGAREFILVDAEKNTQGPAFDHAKLAAALSDAADKKYEPTKLPLESLEFAEDLSAVQFIVDGDRWSCDLESYDCTKWPAADSSQDSNSAGAAAFRGRGFRGGSRNRDRDDDSSDQRRDGGPSPDGKWTASVRDHNIYLKNNSNDEEVQLSHDGVEGNGYGLLRWSPDSQTLVAFRIKPGEEKEVYNVESSPPGGGRAKLHSRPYPLPGDRFTAFELNLFDVASRKQIKPEVDIIDFGFPQLHWYPDKRHFAYEKVDRGHQRLRLIRVDARTGEANNLIDEKSDTFIWTAHTENLDLQLINWLKGSDEIIYVSERDGWRHLYLVDAKTGDTKQITSGEYVIRGIDFIDDDKRQIWFHASGKNPEQDPYFLQYYRVNFDGTGLVALTNGDGNHSVQFSPDRRYLVDTYSRVDKPPVHELRRTKDGSLVRKLEEADISELEATGWKPLEVFHTKGRDGKTEIWGVICRPRDFDPSKKYPVIESIYAGPQGSFVPKSFRADESVFVAGRPGLHPGSDRRHGHGQPLEGVSRRLLAQLEGRRVPGPDPLDESRRRKVSLPGPLPRRHLRGVGGRTELDGRRAVSSGVLQSRRVRLRVPR